MNYTAQDCRTAIKTCKTINPFLTYASDWKQVRRFKSTGGVWVREFTSEKMNDTLFIHEQSNGLVVDTITPDTSWAYRVAPKTEWKNDVEIQFDVFDFNQYDPDIGVPESFEKIGHVLKQLPPGSTEIAFGRFTNANYTLFNFHEMMARVDFINLTPDEFDETNIHQTTGDSDDIWYYEVRTDAEHGDGDFVIITSKAYWDENKHLDDRGMVGGDSLSKVLPTEFSELAESFFEFEGDINDAKEVLDATGRFLEFPFTMHLNSQQVTALYCPSCGTQNVVTNPSQNGGDYLYVAEEFSGMATEFFDDAVSHKCNKCQTQFYMGK